MLLLFCIMAISQMVQIDLFLQMKIIFLIFFTKAFSSFSFSGDAMDPRELSYGENITFVICNINLIPGPHWSPYSGTSTGIYNKRKMSAYPASYLRSPLQGRRRQCNCGKQKRKFSGLEYLIPDLEDEFSARIMKRGNL